MILLVDNYDSFTYNLVQAFGQLGAEVVVRRNDAVSIEEAFGLAPSHIVLSPGPGRPEHAGITVPLVVEAAARRLPLLGVCLGHQAIAVAHGGEVVRAPTPVHGKASRVEHDGRGLFAGLSEPFLAGRYHSLVVREEGLPADLQVTARVHGTRLVMGLGHRVLPIHGVQFHPESLLTDCGQRMLANFVAMT